LGLLHLLSINDKLAKVVLVVDMSKEKLKEGEFNEKNWN
jgi:hypothetical protein